MSNFFFRFYRTTQCSACKSAYCASILRFSALVPTWHHSAQTQSNCNDVILHPQGVNIPIFMNNEHPDQRQFLTHVHAEIPLLNTLQR